MVAITFIATLSSIYGWRIYLELWSHFQVQYLILSLVLLGLLLVLRREWPVWIGSGCCAILSFQIIIWYFPPQWPASDFDLKLLIANVNTNNRSYEKVLQLIRSETPDLGIFMEVDAAWQTQLDTLSEQLPYSSGMSQPQNLGLLVYSNLPLQDPRVEFFGTERNASVVTQLILGDQPITLVATHPFPPVRPSFFHARNRQLDLITQQLTSIDHRIILAGDLNITMWSPYYWRLVSKTGLSNTRKGFGILPTWPTPITYSFLPGWITTFFQIPIDHCLISAGFATTSIKTTGDTGSDHKPLIVTLKLSS